MKQKRLLFLLFAFAAIMIYGCKQAGSSETENGIEIVVHRGANHLAPENTVPSAYAALEHGATWIELDVRMSKDSVMYNLHDDTLDRTTNGEGLLKETLSSDVDTLDAGSWFAPEFAGLRVPRISEMLDSLKGKANVFFDVKRGAPLQQLVNLVREKGFENNSFFWFADPNMLDEFIKLAPEMDVKVNASNIEKLDEWLQVCSPSYVEIAVDAITPEFMAYCHKYDIKVMAAIQNASEEAYLKAIELKPDLVNLDQPELFEKLRAQR